ncbi:MAG TPA: Xaa-Pro peptidase family protein [Bellilinea sp.]|nr:Xaa-Pro peptidase family protein [Bellilinea sp.]
MTASRLNRLYHLMVFAGLDALALNPGPTLFYLTGITFHLMERPTVIVLAPDADPVLVMPELEKPKVSSARIPITPITFGDNMREWDGVFNKAASLLKLDGKRIGVEPTRLRFLELSYLQSAAPNAVFVSGEAALGPLRMQKDTEEISAMRQAAIIAQNALSATLPLVKPGVTERELAAELLINLFRSGSDPELPFAPIVASGPNSANPHAVPSERKVEQDDLLLFDWGASYQGYASDITRTFAVGKVSEEFSRIYELVKQANAAGCQVGKPGLRAGDVDHAARGVIQRGDYGPYFTHRTGHGLGMEAHEAPYIFAENDLLLLEGMVYTVEPGIYLPGKGGVRIEDDMVVTTEGSSSLTDFSRELTIL